MFMVEGSKPDTAPGDNAIIVADEPNQSSAADDAEKPTVDDDSGAKDVGSASPPGEDVVADEKKEAEGPEETSPEPSTEATVNPPSIEEPSCHSDGAEATKEQNTSVTTEEDPKEAEADMPSAPEVSSSFRTFFNDIVNRSTYNVNSLLQPTLLFPLS